MQKKDKIKRARKVTVRFTETEFNKVNTSFKATTKRKLSEYIRYVLLDKPVTVYTRNRSMDDVMTALNLLKNELSAIGNNFNQAVKRLHTISQISEAKSWVDSNEKSKELFIGKTEEINQKINQLFDQWLHE